MPSLNRVESPTRFILFCFEIATHVHFITNYRCITFKTILLLYILVIWLVWLDLIASFNWSLEKWNTFNWCHLHTEIFSKRRKIYSWLSKWLECWRGGLSKAIFRPFTSKVLYFKPHSRLNTAIQSGLGHLHVSKLHFQHWFFKPSAKYFGI